MAIRDLQRALDWEAWTASLTGSKVDAVQLRDKSASDRDLHEAALGLRMALPSEVLLIVNRRPDIALAAGADGVHLPGNGLPTRHVRRAFGDDLLIGRSTHSPDEVRRAAREGADYVLFGPVYETPAKLRFGPPQGLDKLREAVEIGLPVLAVGGITVERLDEVRVAGAHGAAAIRLFASGENRSEPAPTPEEASLHA